MRGISILCISMGIFNMYFAQIIPPRRERAPAKKGRRKSSIPHGSTIIYATIEINPATRLAITTSFWFLMEVLPRRTAQNPAMKNANTPTTNTIIHDINPPFSPASTLLSMQAPSHTFLVIPSVTRSSFCFIRFCMRSPF